MDLKFTSHAWLEYEQYIIDITAFQFGSAFPEVIVDNCFYNELYENKIVTMFDFGIASTDLIGILEDIRILNEISSDC